ncbi:MAG: YggS family pyridoxal phosphate-dependent enzyme [Spirochaetaceae bacterium]|jgi:pyridoxal phosphate enzyme (YggS family)|nr:YggS family pyridoxal phosphate-dependent enzyme [Spirochaetaceae bacterium]
MSIKDNLNAIKERIAKAASDAGRAETDIRLMAVSKFHPIEAVIAAYDAGQTLFGENRVQEIKEKFVSIEARKEKFPGMELHMIGSLQKNKAGQVVQLVDCIESVDRDELIEALAKEAGKRGCTVPLLLELKTGEDSKSGYADADALCRAVEKMLQYPCLQARGLMTMAPFVNDDAAIRGAFIKTRKAFELLKQKFPDCSWETLSMGMSGDFEIAIQEGSNLVRIGTAIFGERT